MAKVAPKRGKNKDNARRSKKKTSVLSSERIDYVDYKDVNLLRRFMSDRAKIRARRVTGNDQQQQAAVAKAIKLSREMALLPYSVRQVQQRSKGRRDRGDREDRERDLAEVEAGVGGEEEEDFEIEAELDAEDEMEEAVLEAELEGADE